MVRVVVWAAAGDPAATRPVVKRASRSVRGYGILSSQFRIWGGCRGVVYQPHRRKDTTTMGARSGQAYVESLRKNAPCVYLGGRRVHDVTAEPLFQEPIRAIAEQYDMQLDPAYRDVMTYPSPTTGEPVSTSFLVPYSLGELVKKRKHF